MYVRTIRFAIKKHVHQSTVKPIININPSNFFSSSSTGCNRKKPNIVDDIRESASGLPWASSSCTHDHVNVVKTKPTTTPSSSSPSNRKEKDDDGDMAGFVADTVKQGVVKAVETGLGVGEMGKRTLDGVWNASKDTAQAVKEAVAGGDDDGKKNDGPGNV